MLFRKRIKRSKFVCSFNESFNTPMKNTPIIFFFRYSFIGTLHRILHSNTPVFYRRFVHKLNDKLYHSLNNYHKNIKLTIEDSPTKFLGTHLYN